MRHITPKPSSQTENDRQVRVAFSEGLTNLTNLSRWAPTSLKEIGNWGEIKPT